MLQRTHALTFLLIGLTAAAPAANAQESLRARDTLFTPDRPLEVTRACDVGP